MHLIYAQSLNSRHCANHPIDNVVIRSIQLSLLIVPDVAGPHLNAWTQSLYRNMQSAQHE